MNEPNHRDAELEPIHFNEEALRMIAESEESFARGEGLTSEEMRSHVRQKAAEWMTQQNHLSA